MLPRLSEQSKGGPPFTSISSSIADGKKDSHHWLEDESKMQRPVEATHKVFHDTKEMLYFCSLGLPFEVRQPILFQATVQYRAVDN